MKISIKNGKVQFIYNDRLRNLLKLGEAKIQRASHVEPTPDNKWCADMSLVSGPVLGPFETREEALKEETTWLQDNYLGKSATTA